ncbi:MAG: hypothetical protein ACLGI6_10805 [Gammaproteobacteria bacterium]
MPRTLKLTLVVAAVLAFWTLAGSPDAGLGGDGVRIYTLHGASWVPVL